MFDGWGGKLLDAVGCEVRVRRGSEREDGRRGLWCGVGVEGLVGESMTVRGRFGLVDLGLR